MILAKLSLIILALAKLSLSKLPLLGILSKTLILSKLRRGRGANHVAHASGGLVRRNALR